MIRKFKILYYSIVGFVYKMLVDLSILNIPTLEGNSDIIVSLTSYGRRVSDNVVYYTLVSLLRQSVQPAKIILWLAEDEWNLANLPKKLIHLQSFGLDIMFCRDIKSYKKLIPTLEKYPNCDIMTVDDDIIYSRDTIKLMLHMHEQYPNVIISQYAENPIIVDGRPQKYNQWEVSQPYAVNQLIFPIGYGGTFYPHGSLHSDVLREDLFMQLCPTADDIWFWFCGLLANTNKMYIPKKHPDYSFDAIHQFFHKGSALTHSNRASHVNDDQFKNLFEFYKLDLRTQFRTL